jgi:hypothetical protein
MKRKDQFTDKVETLHRRFLENLLLKTSLAKRLEGKNNTHICSDTGMCRVSVYNVCKGRNLSVKSLLAVLDSLEMDLVIRSRDANKRERGNKE